MAHNGNTEFMPAFPDPSAWVLDGLEDDWGWYDTDSFGAKPEDMWSSAGEHAGQGTNPDPEDFSAFIFYAWSPPPDNSFYIFSRAQDDTLRALEAKGDWWNDDVLQLIFDWDHSSHGPDNANETELMNRNAMHPLGSKLEGAHMAPYSEEEGPLGWGGFPPYTYVDVTILPAGSTHFATNVEYTYEMRIVPWQSYALSGPDESVVWTFEQEQVVHFTYRFDDGDRTENGEQDLWSPNGEAYQCDRTGSECSGYILVATDMVDPYTEWDPDTGIATAVQNTTWARIKNHMSN